MHIIDRAFWLASFEGALLISSLVAILRSSTAEHPTVNRTVTGSNPVAGADAPGPCELRPGTWTRLMVAVMRLAGGPDLGILLGSGP